MKTKGKGRKGKKFSILREDHDSAQTIFSMWLPVVSMLTSINKHRRDFFYGPIDQVAKVVLISPVSYLIYRI